MWMRVCVSLLIFLGQVITGVLALKILGISIGFYDEVFLPLCNVFKWPACGILVVL
jgi:hypothetical protein